MYVLLILICILCSSFFASLEIGLLSADQLAIYLKKERGVFYARAADFLLLKPERLLGTTLIGTNISVVTAAILFSSALRQLGFSLASWAGVLALSFVLLISEIILKSFFRRHADTISVKLAPVLVIFYFLFLPLSIILNTIVNSLLYLFGQYDRKSKLPQSKEDLRLLVRLGTRESVLARSDRIVFEDIFDFRDTLAREVMIQIHKHPVCHIDSSPRNVVKVALESGCRFIPIYKERADNLIGYIDIEDLFTFSPQLPGLSPDKNNVDSIREIIRDAVYYPDIKRIPELLLEMNTRNLDVAFLSDEYGAISGMITPYEIASEIIGFIPGEQTGLGQEIRMINPDHYLVSGTADIEDIRNETGIQLKRGNYDTVGGFLCDRLGEIPGVGDTYVENGIYYKIVDRDDRHIKRIEIVKRG